MLHIAAIYIIGKSSIALEYKKAHVSRQNSETGSPLPQSVLQIPTAQPNREKKMQRTQTRAASGIRATMYGRGGHRPTCTGLFKSLLTNQRLNFSKQLRIIQHP